MLFGEFSKILFRLPRHGGKEKEREMCVGKGGGGYENESEHAVCAILSIFKLLI